MRDEPLQLVAGCETQRLVLGQALEKVAVGQAFAPVDEGNQMLPQPTVVVSDAEALEYEEVAVTTGREAVLTSKTRMGLNRAAACEEIAALLRSNPLKVHVSC
jgi:hypothetical protein